MKRTFFKQGLLAGVAVFALALTVPLVAQAQAENLPDRAREAQKTVEERREAAQSTVQEKKQAAQQRLSDAKLKVCQNREEKITNIMARISDRGQKQIDLFTKIAERTQTFYTEKGKTLANYDELVADVTTKKTAAQETVDELKATSADFDCSGDDPRGVATTFKESLKKEIEALKAYKTSVKNLIVGVKSVQSTTSSTENQETNE